jgi:hypothetical protein
MNKNVKLIGGIILFAAAAYFAVKLTGSKPASVRDTLRQTGLWKGALGTVKMSESLAVPEGDLRGACVMTKIDPHTLPPEFPADKNPYITEKPDQVDFATMEGFGRIPAADVSQAGAALFVNASGTTGVWALQFRSAEAAKNALPMMHPGPVLRKEGLVLTLWHDDSAGTDCESAVKSYFTGSGFEDTMGGPR